MIKAFFEPVRIAEALRFKREMGDASAFIAGGTEINASYSPAPPENLISLARLDLGRIRTDAGAWAIPANATVQEILDTEGIPRILAEACRNIVNRNVRNMATIGGHIASNKSSADVLPALVVLEAKVDVSVVGDGSAASLPIMDLIEKKQPAHLITGVAVPDGNGRAFAIENYTRNANDMSVLTAAVALEADSDTVERPIIAVGGVAPHIVRLSGLEQALSGKALPAAEQLEEQVASEVSPISDLRGSAELKKYLAGVLVARALDRAQVGGGKR